MHDFHKTLTFWYQQYIRHLPWRLNKDPYSVWVSEIILQQTRINQGTDYYIRFINRFPDVKSLAVADEDEVLKIWQGLGYYSRARNMHLTAKQIVNEYNSCFPKTYNELRNLKGIGDYTAAAIASISFDCNKAAVDGNVYRVLSRIFGIATPISTSKGKKEIAELAQSLLDKQNPGQFNEAMMEFGALQCVPRNPSCSQCPFMNNCIALKNNLVSQLPVRLKEIKQRKRYFNYLFISYRRSFYLEQRNAKDIWHNLYQLPLIETSETVDENKIADLPEFKSHFKGVKPAVKNITPEIIHTLTHQRLYIRYFHITINRMIANSRCVLTNEAEYSKFPLPKPIANYLSHKLAKHKTVQ